MGRYRKGKERYFLPLDQSDANASSSEWLTSNLLIYCCAIFSQNTVSWLVDSRITIKPARRQRYTELVKVGRTNRLGFLQTVCLAVAVYLSFQPASHARPASRARQLQIVVPRRQRCYSHAAHAFCCSALGRCGTGSSDATVRQSADSVCTDKTDLQLLTVTFTMAFTMTIHCRIGSLRRLSSLLHATGKSFLHSAVDVLLLRPCRGAEYCDQFVCLSMCPRAYLWNRWTDPQEFLRRSPAAVARSFSGGVAIRYVIPVL